MTCLLIKLLYALDREMSRPVQILVLIIVLLFSEASFSAEQKEKRVSGPAKNGALIYSNNIQDLSKFYKSLFSMQVSKETSDFVSLYKDGFNIIIHTPPDKIPGAEFSPIKLFLTVQSLDKTRELALELGGQVFEGQWSNPMFTVSNIADSDGNHIQIREFVYNE